MADTIDITQAANMELATFYVGKSLYGIDIMSIQEINKHFEVTKVPQAEDYIIGILNLRGKIVTILDIGKKIGLSHIEKTKENRNIIIRSQDEYIGLLVDSIGDVVIADKNSLEPAPANLGGLEGKFFSSVLKTEKDLIGILNIEEVLKD